MLRQHFIEASIAFMPAPHLMLTWQPDPGCCAVGPNVMKGDSLSRLCSTNDTQHQRSHMGVIAINLFSTFSFKVFSALLCPAGTSFATWPRNLEDGETTIKKS
jgi:hypothetical protein